MLSKKCALFALFVFVGSILLPACAGAEGVRAGCPAGKEVFVPIFPGERSKR